MMNSDIFSTLGEQNLRRQAGTIGLPAMIRTGLPPESAFTIQKAVGVSSHVLEKIVGVSYRTLQRHLENKTRLSSVASDRVVRFLGVLHEAAETLGSTKNGIEWIKRPCLPLADQKPIDMLDTIAGTSEVSDILGRIRHGVFS